MNRFVLGTCLLVLSPFVAGCGNFYILTPPAPQPTPTPVPPAPDFPIDPAEGINTTLSTPTQGIPLNTAPTKFRSVDIRYEPRIANDPANCLALLVLQTATPLASAATSTTGSAPVSLGASDTSNPVHLAGIIVPGPRGQAAAGLQDPDLLALQDLAYQGSLKALRAWTQLPLSDLSTITVTATPTARPTTRPQTLVRSAPTPLPNALGARDLDVFQDPRYPIDSDSRRTVQAFFTSVEGIKVKPTTAPGSAPSNAPAQVLVKPNTALSLNRMMIRSGWAVVDLYSSTSFDQPTWLLDEAYARQRKLGMWGLQLNGKRFVLQQRPPATTDITSSPSNVSLVPNTGSGTPGATPTGGVTSPGATQSPSVRPTGAAKPAQFPRVITKSGTSVLRGPLTSDKLPPAGTSQGSAAAPATSPDGSTGNTASG